MLYILFMLTVTFVSTFMTADTVSHVGQLKSDSVGKLFLSVWLAALCLTILDGDWFTTLGWVHTAIFLCSYSLARLGQTVEHTSKDFIKNPVVYFVPCFLITYFIFG